MHPNSATDSNSLAWAYATAPEHPRDPGRALALAESAAGLDPHDPLIRNTLGVAYYREAAETLRANLPGQKEKHLAAGLYFQAMSHHQLGEVALARAYYTWARRLARLQGELSVEESQEWAAFHAEAEVLVGE